MRLLNAREVNNLEAAARLLALDAEKRAITISLANLAAQIGISGGGLSQEDIEDIIGNALESGTHTGATFTYDDATGTISVVITGGPFASDADVVHKTGNETISGVKTFFNSTLFNDVVTMHRPVVERTVGDISDLLFKTATVQSNRSDNNYSGLFFNLQGVQFFRQGDNGNNLELDFSNFTAPRKFDLPDASGTIALISDLNSSISAITGNFVTLNTPQTIISVKRHESGIVMDPIGGNGSINALVWRGGTSPYNRLIGVNDDELFFSNRGLAWRRGDSGVNTGIELIHNNTSVHQILFPNRDMDLGNLAGELDTEIGTAWRTGGGGSTDLTGISFVPSTSNLALTHENSFNIGDRDKHKINSTTNVKVFPATDAVTGDWWYGRQAGNGQIEFDFPDADTGLYYRTTGLGTHWQVDYNGTGYEISGNLETYTRDALANSIFIENWKSSTLLGPDASDITTLTGNINGYDASQGVAGDYPVVSVASDGQKEIDYSTNTTANLIVEDSETALNLDPQGSGCIVMVTGEKPWVANDWLMHKGDSSSSVTGTQYGFYTTTSGILANVGGVASASFTGINDGVHVLIVNWSGGTAEYYVDNVLRFTFSPGTRIAAQDLRFGERASGGSNATSSVRAYAVGNAPANAALRAEIQNQYGN